jgi:3-isopropylmalate/(R)-2-methylmalate dehydratase small subunit
MLPIALPEAEVDELFRRAAGGQYHLTVDLAAQTLTDSAGLQFAFDVDPFRKHCLVHALDDIGLTLAHEQRITAYENDRGLAPIAR